MICLWPLANKKADALGFCVSFGMLTGAMVGLPASCVARIIPNERHDSLGVWTGMMWSYCSFLAFAGPPIAGVLHGRYGIETVGYWTGANLFIASLLSAAALLLSIQADRNIAASGYAKDGAEEAEVQKDIGVSVDSAGANDKVDGRHPRCTIHSLGSQSIELPTHAAGGGRE